MPRLLFTAILFTAIVVALSATPASAVFRVTPERPVFAPVPAPAEGVHTPAAIASDGSRFVIFWVNYGILSATSVAEDGTVEGTITIPTASLIDALSACWTGSPYLATWQEGTDVQAATLDRDGSLFSPAHVIAKDARTRSGSLASNGRRAFVAYTAYPSILVSCAVLDVNSNVVIADVPLSTPTSLQT